LKNSPREPAGPDRRKLFASLSIRNRIAIYFTGATALLIAIVFTAIIFMVDSVVYRHYDEVLYKEAVETLDEAHISKDRFEGFTGTARYDDDGFDDDDFMERHHKTRHREIESEYIQFADSEGRIVRKSSNLFDNTLDIDKGKHGTMFRNSTIGSSTFRQVQIPLSGRNGNRNGYLVVAVPVKGALLVIRDMTSIIVISFPIIILVLFLLTRLIAGQSIRPIDEVIAAAETITQSNLDQRIPLPANHDELYRMSVTVNELLNRLQHAFQREKQFTADASHELKTPLAIVKGTLEVVVRKPRTVEHYESRINACLTELNRMAKLIDQLLLLARDETQSMQPAIMEIDPAGPLEAVMSRMQPFARDKGSSLVLTNASPCRVKADPSLLEIMFENLLSNAIKYSPEGSLVDIRIEQKKKSVVCTIEDHGIGIPEEKLPVIFNRFYRVDESRSSSTGGSGLGLSIVKKLADLQSITLSVRSETEKGTVFELVFTAGGAVN
jgi:heavy metal sensor kinase